MGARCVHEEHKAQCHCMPSASGVCYKQCDRHKASNWWMQRLKQKRARAQLTNTKTCTDCCNHKAAITWQSRLPHERQHVQAALQKDNHPDCPDCRQAMSHISLERKHSSSRLHYHRCRGNKQQEVR